MALPTWMLTTTCDIYRPFGAASATATNVPCRLSPMVSASDHPAGILWTHTLDVQPGVELHDGFTRTSGDSDVTYADGDEVRVPGGGSTRYVVVWIEVIARDTPRQHQRAYLLRHAAAFPDP